MSEGSDASVTALLALLLCVPFSIGLFYRFPPYKAAFLALLIGALVLPVGYGWDVPGVTRLDKGSLPLFASIAGCLIAAPSQVRYLRIRGPTLLFLAAILIGPFLTAASNELPVDVGGGVVLQGLTARDGFALFRALAFTLAVPFLFGRMLVRSVAQLEYLMRAIVAALLIYSIPMLYEIRMSPQLHIMVYGYFPHSFLQQARAGGFRPVVFIGHGLPLAILTAFATLASVMLWRRRRRIRGLPPAVVSGYLGALLVLCKTFSAMVYGAAGGALIYLASPKIQARVSAVLAAIVLSYPVSRAMDFFPTTTLVQLSDSASEERSDSLAFRFRNEDVLLSHARERWLLGWGGYGRDRVFNDEGADISVTDGLWIILLGQLGAVGFLAVFGLMVAPIFQCGRALRNVASEADRRLLASVAVLVAFNWVDSLPNALSGGIVMVFVTGAFSGAVESYRKPQRRLRAPDEKPLASVRNAPST